MSNELPPPTGYATHNGMRSLQQDDATVLLYPHDYLIRPDQVPLYTADQLREYGRARERAAYKRAAQQCLIVRHNAPDNLSYQEGCTDCADAIRALGADK